MSLQVRMSQRQEQRMALLPQMLQSIEILQLATAELLTRIDEELQQNETLEAAPVAEVLPDATPLPRQEWEDSGWQEPVARGPAGDDDGEDGKRAFLENQSGGETESLVDFVRMQVAWEGLPKHLAAAVILLAENLDDRGLLVVPVAEVAAANGLAPDLLTEAHCVLKSLQPVGIGAGSPIEAMLLQAAGDPDLPTIERLLRDHLDALARNKLPEVARALAISLDDLQGLLQRIGELDPRPGAAFATQAAAPVRPEAFAWLADGEVKVALDDRSLPELAVSPEYASLAADRSVDRSVRAYLRAKVRSAKELIGAISHRHDTLLAVVAAVMQEQRPFLIEGRAAIRPLRMAEIAERLGLHTSTISRAIAGKYVQTERGVFLLRDFFDGGRGEAVAEQGHGKMAVAQRLGELIDQEDKRQPLSDDDLVAALAQRGIEVARRTVTKYRKELGIASSYRRRRHEGGA